MWDVVEPKRSDPPHYRWARLEGLEQQLLNAASADITVMLLVRNTPPWAQAFPGHKCGPIRADRLDEFAEFLSAVVDRYSQPPYSIKHWELINEPDIDPSLVSPGSVFGCWGDDSDEYYGGSRYAQMLKYAYAAIKRADPQALVIAGGLLLDAPDGLPSSFLAGMLEGGGGEYFDILAFHAYSVFSPNSPDWEMSPGTGWQEWGGIVAGKVRYLRQVLSSYGYEKPLLLNEAGLAWMPAEEPAEEYRQAQADYVVQLYARGLALGLEGVTWHGWREPTWRHMGFLHEDLSPTPGYHALAFALEQLHGVEYGGPTAYEGLEGYSFERGSELVQVVWSTDGEEHTIEIPSRLLVHALNQFGQPLQAQRSEDTVALRVRRPVYIQLLH
jgi:hypothetical protein